MLWLGAARPRVASNPPLKPQAPSMHEAAAPVAPVGQQGTRTVDGQTACCRQAGQGLRPRVDRLQGGILGRGHGQLG